MVKSETNHLMTLMVIDNVMLPDIMSESLGGWCKLASYLTAGVTLTTVQCLMH